MTSSDFFKVQVSLPIEYTLQKRLSTIDLLFSSEKNQQQSSHLVHLPLPPKRSGPVPRCGNKKMKCIVPLKKILNIMHYPKEYNLPVQNSYALFYDFDCVPVTFILKLKTLTVALLHSMLHF